VLLSPTVIVHDQHPYFRAEETKLLRPGTQVQAHGSVSSAPEPGIPASMRRLHRCPPRPRSSRGSHSTLSGLQCREIWKATSTSQSHIGRLDPQAVQSTRVSVPAGDAIGYKLGDSKGARCLKICLREGEPRCRWPLSQKSPETWKFSYPIQTEPAFISL